ncbi:hypothetical protein [Burkholderia ubonensis]|uniref:Uncharacterized protein n=1 Tax=Burkholderia ubonensis subsp. mesacidophila TaxID=265293 RepID=A0A2A4FAF3_9BURK|nr:hypothetical protein [Burkholderia ubonensis]PCE29997.1 hypothetical protein BZL54_22805 [Burkholderia ubonensis subsp. mesacidophila]
MSKLGCQCGNVICDNTNSLPYKAALLKDSFSEPFSDWLVSELQSYVVAAEQGSVRSWLLSRGYTEDYLSLQLDHGNVLHDHLLCRLIDLRRTAYECSECGRLHVETVDDNAFVSYSPDSKKNNGVLSE